MTDPNGSRRQIDGILLSEMRELRTEVRDLRDRMIKLETHATMRGALGGAVTSLIGAVAFALFWVFRGS